MVKIVAQCRRSAQGVRQKQSSDAQRLCGRRRFSIAQQALEMATPWQTLFNSPTRRRQTILIILSALVPFTFCFIWLLSLSHPPTLAHPDETAHSIQKFTLKAPTGSYTGKVNEIYENVHEFLNVPYGLSTAGKNRFMPPVPVPKSDETFDATQIAMACPQFVSSARSIWSEQIPWYRIPHGNINSPGETADLTSEDCLSLAIWTPTNATADSELPVAMFWPGKDRYSIRLKKHLC